MKHPILLIAAISTLLAACAKELNDGKDMPAKHPSSTAQMSSPHSDTIKFNSVLGFLTGSTTTIGNGSSDRTAYPSTEIMAGVWTVGGTAYALNGYFFTTQALAPNANDIQSATLVLFSNPTPLNGDRIHANSGTYNGFYVQRVTGNWDIFNLGAIRWGSQPVATTTDQVLIPHTDLPFLDLEVDVTAMVRRAVTNGETVIGFKLKPVATSPLNMRNFVSCDHERTDLQPRLLIDYN